VAEAIKVMLCNTMFVADATVAALQHVQLVSTARCVLETLTAARHAGAVSTTVE
jgi:hypothetical protein